MRAITLLGLLAMAVAVHPSTPASAEPLEEIAASVSDFDGVSATVAISWNHDDGAASYEVGCVSCNPNTSEPTTHDSAELQGVTPFPNSQSAMLYVIAYDSENEIIGAKQLIISLGV